MYKKLMLLVAMLVFSLTLYFMKHYHVHLFPRKNPQEL